MIGERLHELRKDAGLTQNDLALILNINKHSISSYERNKSEPPDAIKIAISRYFNVTVDYLVGLTDNPTPIERQDTVVRLPNGFPHEMYAELLDYAGYLMYKNEKKKAKT